MEDRVYDNQNMSDEYRAFVALNPTLMPNSLSISTNSHGEDRSSVMLHQNASKIPTEGHALFYELAEQRARRERGTETDREYLEWLAPETIVLHEGASDEYRLFAELMNARNHPRIEGVGRFDYSVRAFGNCVTAEYTLLAAMQSLVDGTDMQDRYLGATPLVLYVDDNLTPHFIKKFYEAHTGMSLRPFYSNDLLYPAGTLVSPHTHEELDRFDPDAKTISLTVTDVDDNEHVLYDGMTEDWRSLRIVHIDAISSVSPDRLTPWAHEDLKDRELFAAVYRTEDDRVIHSTELKAMFQAPLSENLVGINAAIAHYLGARP